MKIQQCENNGVSGWQYGDEGRCFVGNEAFQKAKREELAARAAEFKENPAELPSERKARLQEKHAKEIERSTERTEKVAKQKAEKIKNAKP